MTGVEQSGSRTVMCAAGYSYPFVSTGRPVNVASCQSVPVTSASIRTGAESSAETGSVAAVMMTLQQRSARLHLQPE
jgi:hypothetical protein